MPANLTPQYHAAELQYRAARTPEEKLDALLIMFREMPKHKGTCHMQADLKRRISEARKLVTSEKQSKKSGVSYHVDSHGYRQVIFVGAPNSGKSQLLAQLTGQPFKVADYPYTTRVPQPAMMKFEDIMIQLVDTPAISEDHKDSWMPGLVRAGDAVVWVLDLSSDDILKDMELLEKFFQEQNVYLIGDQEESELPESADIQSTLLIGNKCDIDGHEIIRDFVNEVYQKRFTLLEVSAKDSMNLNTLRRKIFEILGIIRIYPKPPGKKPDLSVEPIILNKGSTIWDLADHIHHDMAQRLKSGRVWNSTRYPENQKLPIDSELDDRNVVELEA